MSVVWSSSGYARVRVRASVMHLCACVEKCVRVCCVVCVFVRACTRVSIAAIPLTKRPMITSLQQAFLGARTHSVHPSLSRNKMMPGRPSSVYTTRPPVESWPKPPRHSSATRLRTQVMMSTTGQRLKMITSRKVAGRQRRSGRFEWLSEVSYDRHRGGEAHRHERISLGLRAREHRSIA